MSCECGCTWTMTSRWIIKSGIYWPKLMHPVRIMTIYRVADTMVCKRWQMDARISSKQGQRSITWICVQLEELRRMSLKCAELKMRKHKIFIFVAKLMIVVVVWCWCGGDVVMMCVMWWLIVLCWLSFLVSALYSFLFLFLFLFLLCIIAVVV